MGVVCVSLCSHARHISALAVCIRIAQIAHAQPGPSVISITGITKTLPQTTANDTQTHLPTNSVLTKTHK